MLNALPTPVPPLELPDDAKYIRIRYHPHTHQLDVIERLDIPLSTEGDAKVPEDLGTGDAALFLRQLPYLWPWALFQN
jgi:hypothetical protein